MDSALKIKLYSSPLLVAASIQEMAFSVRGKPINGRHIVTASISIPLVLPTLIFAEACAFA